MFGLRETGDWDKFLMAEAGGTEGGMGEGGDWWS